MSILRRDLFTSILSEETDDNRYFLLQPKGNPIILFSEIDGSALASIHLRCQDNHYQNNQKKNRGTALFTKRPLKSEFKCDFQGIISRDNQEFEFAITNLAGDGFINFNIMKKDILVTQTDPGAPDGLNKINEIRPFHSHIIQSDQLDNTTLILNSITVKKKNDTDKEQEKETKLTIKEAEAEATTQSPHPAPISTYQSSPKPTDQISSTVSKRRSGRAWIFYTSRRRFNV